MLKTKDLILDKAKFSDWCAMYVNVWSRPEAAKYMLWNLTTNEEDAKIRIQKTIDFQKSHDTYLVYEKNTGTAIGFAGVEEIEQNVCGEVGICLGPDYVGKGYGKQILLCLMKYCKENYGAKVFVYSSREDNEASKGLARSFGFQLIGKERKIDDRNQKPYIMLKYSLQL